MMSTLDRVLVRVSALSLLFAVSACGASSSQGLDARAASPEPTVAEQKAAADELYRLGRKQARAGDSLRAQEYFATAIDSGGDANVILPELMRAAIAGTRYQAAIRYFEDYGPLLNRRNRADCPQLLCRVCRSLYRSIAAWVWNRRENWRLC